MKKQFFVMLILLCSVQLAFAQGSSSVVRLNSGAEVTNSIFWRNFGYIPTSFGVSVTYSAMDTLTSGTGNIRLLGTPFVDNRHRINSASPAYNAGTNMVLNPWSDTLDLGYDPRVNCDQIDMGAYEYQAIPTKILVQPYSDPICEGTPAQLRVVAEGTTLSYQWQRSADGTTGWANLDGETNPTLNLEGDISEEGFYRMIVFGDCCNDTSVNVRVIIDLDPEPYLVVMADTTILPGESVQLTVIEHIGTVTWYTGNLSEQVPEPYLIENITANQRYVAVARNGACSDPVFAEVFIFVEDYVRCHIQTFTNVVICPGDSYLLLLDSATVDYTWTDLSTGLEVDKFTIVSPESTTQYKATSLDGLCYDVLTVTVHQIDFVVMDGRDYMYVCGTGGSITLYSSPPARWDSKDGSISMQSDRFGFLEFFALNEITTEMVATYNDGTCEVTRDFSIHAHPSSLRAFPEHATICEGDSIQLFTDYNAGFITWYRGNRDEVLDFDPQTPGPFVKPTVSTTYQAWIHSSECGSVFSQILVTVQPKPELRVTTPSEVCENTPFFLASTPNATFWVTSQDERVFNPIMPTVGETYTAWFTDGVCTVSETAVFTIVPRPSTPFTVSNDTTIIFGNSIEIWSSETAYWSQSHGPYLGQHESLTLTPTYAGMHHFVADLRHACQIRDTVRVDVVYEVVEVIHVRHDSAVITVDYGMSCTENTGWFVVTVENVTTYPLEYIVTDRLGNVITRDSARSGLAEGYYIITIRDAIDSVAVEFANPTRSPSIGITWSLVEPSNENCDGGRITTIISGGVAPFTYWWSDIQDYGESVRHHMVPGTYTLLVEDETGCRQNAVITMNCLFRIALPSTYVSPNDDGHNDFLYIENIHYYPNNRVLILNSLGELVKTLRNYDNETVKWDGRNERGQVLPDGVYYYILEPEGMAPIAGWLLMRASKFGK